MLEKWGLPAKPSAKGCTWAIDAANCQGCNSQFSFFNRKHHCRRCGGLFCGNCTASRMQLRNQGDSPVRICEPCKKLEEAARFEARHGHRNKQRKVVADDPDLNTLLKELPSTSNDGKPDGTPASLDQRAQEERAKYLSLRKEGKPEEATKAFKRYKELDRQADAARKNSKLSSGGDGTTAARKPASETEDLMQSLKDLGWNDTNEGEAEDSDAAILAGIGGGGGGGGGAKPRAAAATSSIDAEIMSHKRKALAFKKQGNLADAKEELKKAKVLEKRKEDLEILGGDGDEDKDDDGDEFSAFLRSLEKEASLDPNVAMDSSSFQVDNLPDLAGLGDLDVGDDAMDMDMDDTDMFDPDIMAALTDMGWSDDTPRASDGAGSPDLQAQIQAHKLKAIALKREGKVEDARAELKQAKALEQEMEEGVTEQDMSDPHILAALAEVGFGDASAATTVKAKDKRTITREIISLKKSVLQLRREGKAAEAEAALQQAKVLEEELERLQTPPKESHVVAHASTSSKTAVKDSKGKEAAAAPKKSKREIQSELLGIKRRALALRREGKVEEAEKVLQPVKALEMQLEALEGRPTVSAVSVPTLPEDEPEDEEVTDEDMRDPAMLAALAAIGFEPPVLPEKPRAATVKSEQLLIVEDVFSHVAASSSSAPVQQNGVVDFLTGDDWNPTPMIVEEVNVASTVVDQRPSEQKTTIVSEVPSASTSASEEIMAHKRKAVAFKREGNMAAAKEELLQAKALEKKLNAGVAEVKQEVKQEVKEEVKQPEPPVRQQASTKDRRKLQRDALDLKRKSLALRREGKIDEADATFEKAKEVEKLLAEMEVPQQQARGVDGVESLFDPQLVAALEGVGLKTPAIQAPPPQTISSKDVEKQVKALKLQAVELKRAGKLQEALMCLQQAKRLQAVA